ncbi:hypothetical protein [Ruminiclostridium josui]|uniref:hypothetical protein n=1 Tax=Ruminiclostridium josui TaxID=1499 RepID=UPI0006D0052C|nr:hypothetical protein [Ruminiclostridium josui]
MLCTGYFSASMNELIQKSQRDRLYLFAMDFFNAITEKIPIAKMYQPYSIIVTDIFRENLPVR